MTPEMWNTILTGVVLIIIGAVGWMARTVIWTAGEVKKLNAVLNIAELNEEIDTVHKRVSRLGEKVSKVDGQLKAVENLTGQINQHLMSAGR